MKEANDVRVSCIIREHSNEIKYGGYTSIYDYLVSRAEDGAGYAEWFEDEEMYENNGEPTDEQIEDVKHWLFENFYYLPNYCYY